MTETLHAWRDGRHVATFTRTTHGIDMAYDDASQLPLSLSLPVTGRWNRKRPEQWLNGLLPENPYTRHALASRHGIDDNPGNVFDLLLIAGADVAGAISLLPDGVEPGSLQDSSRLVTNDEIHDAIDAIRRTQIVPKTVTGSRMSVAGAQPKFALAHRDGQWWTPSASTPSTHIIKPAAPEHHRLDDIEASSLALAHDIGLDATDTTMIHGAFTALRFDRVSTDHGLHRRHMEDLSQAMGVDAENKYSVGAGKAVSFLRDVGGDELAYSFVQQLAFNTYLGNADAHAKNYSMFLDGPTPAMTPLYDTVPIVLYPQYKPDLAMPIAGAKRSAEVTMNHWSRFATHTGLDPDRVMHDVSSIVTGMREHAAEHGLDKAITATTKNIEPLSVPAFTPRVENMQVDVVDDGLDTWNESLTEYAHRNQVQRRHPATGITGGPDDAPVQWTTPEHAPRHDVNNPEMG